MTKFYPLGDILSVEERREFGAGKEQRYGNLGGGQSVRAAKTQAFREPRKGEWYLSGALATAYRAPTDLEIGYRIMCLVVTRTTTVEVEALVIKGACYDQRQND